MLVHLPFWWTVIDMSFGVFGVIPLLFVRRLIKRLEKSTPDVRAAVTV